MSKNSRNQINLCKGFATKFIQGQLLRLKGGDSFLSSRRQLNRIYSKIDKIAKNTKLNAKPQFITIEPTAKCNLTCIMCTRRTVARHHTQHSGFISEEIIDKVNPFLPTARSVLFSGFGEPLLHPDYFRLATRIKKSGVHLWLITNGQLLTPEKSEKCVQIGIDKIFVSLDSPDPQTYKSIRGAGIDTLITNLNAMQRIKQKKKSRYPSIHIDMISFLSTLPQLQDMLILAKKLGVESVGLQPLFPTTQELVKESVWNNLGLAHRVLEDGEKTAKELGINLRLAGHSGFIDEHRDCRQIFNGIFITWDGKCLSCDQERYIIGDLKQNTIQEIWNNSMYIKLRKKYYNAGLPNLCPGCFKWNCTREVFLNVYSATRDKNTLKAEDEAYTFKQSHL